MKIPFNQLLQAGAHFAPANGVAGLQPGGEAAAGMPTGLSVPGGALAGGAGTPQLPSGFIDQVMHGIQLPSLAAVSGDDAGAEDPGMSAASLSALMSLAQMPQAQAQQAVVQPQQPPQPQAGAVQQAGQGGAGGPAMPSANDKAPPGASAQSIVDGNPTLKNLGNQSGVKDNLKKQCGDWDDPSKSPQERADAAQRASNVVDWVKNAKDRDGEPRTGDVTKNGKIEGFTKDGDARHGTEAGLLQDFGKYGYSHLQADQRLDQTNDGHVKKNGTNMDNAEYIGHKILDGLSKAFNFIGDLIKNTLGKIPGLGKVFSALAEVGTKAIGGALHVADTAVIGGDVKKAGVEMGASLTETAVGFADPTGLGAKAAGDAVRGSYKG